MKNVDPALDEVRAKAAVIFVSLLPFAFSVLWVFVGGGGGGNVVVS